MNPVTSTTLCLLIFNGAATLQAAASADDLQPSAAPTNDVAQPSEDQVPDDAPLKAFRATLLDLAFQSASAIPVDPHIKDRSRAQEAVIAMCLELDQPQRAARYIAGVENWRRGSCYADLAFYCAQHGYTSVVQDYLGRAASIYASEEDWRRDRIKSKIARTHAWMGEQRKAEALTVDLLDSEAGRVDAVRARRADEASFAEQMEGLQAAIDSESFDTITGALWTATELYRRFYTHPTRREQIASMIDRASKSIPALVNMNLKLKLGDIALEQKDASTAVAMIDDAQSSLANVNLMAEDEVPLLARLAAARFKAGDTTGARRDIHGALTMYDNETETIISVFRAETLTPVAETLASMGEQRAAIDVYARALREGDSNPNQRPRAMDVSLICASLARSAVEPDEDLWTRLRRAVEGLN